MIDNFFKLIKNNLINENWNGLNILVQNASTVGLLDLKNYAADFDVQSNLIRVHSPSNLTQQESTKISESFSCKEKSWIRGLCRAINFRNIQTLLYKPCWGQSYFRWVI